LGEAIGPGGENMPNGDVAEDDVEGRDDDPPTSSALLNSPFSIGLFGELELALPLSPPDEEVPHCCSSLLPLLLFVGDWDDVGDEEEPWTGCCCCCEERLEKRPRKSNDRPSSCTKNSSSGYGED
jgi:hypothetical protein